MILGDQSSCSKTAEKKFDVYTKMVEGSLGRLSNSISNLYVTFRPVLDNDVREATPEKCTKDKPKELSDFENMMNKIISGINSFSDRVDDIISRSAI